MEDEIITPDAGEASDPTGTEVETPTTEDVGTDVDGTDIGDTGQEQEHESVEVDWSSRVAEWGGEDEIKGALALQDALRTREGVATLFQEAANALGIGEKAAALFGGDGGTDDEKPESIEDILSDPDRVLTAGEVARLLEHQQSQQTQQQQAQQQAASVVSSIDSVFSELGVAEADRNVIFAIADQIHGKAAVTPESAASAVRRAHAQFNAQVEAAAKKIVQDKAAVHKDIPKPLPAGGSSGGESLPEPRTVAEAKARVRKMMGI